MKKIGVAAAMMLCAVGASASNFRGADQVYVPTAGHLQGSSGTFISDVYISNLDDEEVSVSVIYQPLGENGGSGTEFANQITLLRMLLVPLFAFVNVWCARQKL